MTNIILLQETQAGDLLDALREHMEALLQRYAITEPPSQSYRAKALRVLLQRTISDNCKFALHSWEQKRQLLHDRDACDLFLGVHATVTELEWLARNGHVRWPTTEPAKEP